MLAPEYKYRCRRGDAASVKLIMFQAASPEISSGVTIDRLFKRHIAVAIYKRID